MHSHHIRREQVGTVLDAFTPHSPRAGGDCSRCIHTTFAGSMWGLFSMHSHHIRREHVGTVLDAFTPHSPRAGGDCSRCIHTTFAESRWGLFSMHSHHIRREQVGTVRLPPLRSMPSQAYRRAQWGPFENGPNYPSPPSVWPHHPSPPSLWPDPPLATICPASPSLATICPASPSLATISLASPFPATSHPGRPPPTSASLPDSRAPPQADTTTGSHARASHNRCAPPHHSPADNPDAARS
jgi:hypothetical protein